MKRLGVTSTDQGGGKRRTRLGRMYAGRGFSHSKAAGHTKPTALPSLVLCSLESAGFELWSVAKRKSDQGSIRPRTLAFEGLCGHRHGLISAATTPAAWRYSPRSGRAERCLIEMIVFSPRKV